jgi:GNAT superfamily N-acetyltransferase
VIYRLATPADFDQLARLRWDFRAEYTADPPPIAWEDFLEAMRAFLREAFESGMWAVWVAEADGQVVAQAFIQRIRKVPRPAALERYFGYVTNVYTRPAFRNQGVGAELMRQVQAWAKEQQLEMLVLWPSKKAVSFYERAGFIYPTEAMEWEVEE